ncbi:MAG: helix-turn-helix transcriptional regulator [Candidatus Sedimenticola sp. (ex Thyasira tokunagai)]
MSGVVRFFLRELISQKCFNEDRRITLDEVAAETGISRNTLSRIANTKGYNATTDVIDRLCQYFDCPVEQVMEYVEGGKDATTRG